jgi:PAS domain-containing protein
MTVQPLLLAGAIGFLASLTALGLFAMLRTPRRAGPRLGGRLQFEGRALVASDGGARRAFNDSPPRGDDWDRAVALLDSQFPDLDARRAPSVLPEGRIRSPHTDDVLTVRRNGSIVTLAVERGTARTAPEEADGDRTPEVEAFRAATQLLPFPVWMEDAAGRMFWANAAYLALAADLHPDADDETWPPPRLFDPALVPPASRVGAHGRVPTGSANGAPRHWFDVHARLDGERAFYAASNADDAVRAETRLRDFSQTLTKTFAQLTIGLAVFDPSRRLVVFNPALVDMTGLPADTLSARPTLMGFLDRLRERRIIPEPKDYAGWRRKMAELEAAATEGVYAETWSLPGGQTYRVTGQPHPDGAVIFLFEDITAEISLTRRFRAELEMGQAVIDSLEDAVAVFTPDGVLAMTNAAYVALWNHHADTRPSRMSVAETTAVWLAHSAPTPVWGDFRDFVHQGQNRVEWSADVVLRDGRCFLCRFAPITGGGTLAWFQPRAGGPLRAEPGARQTA